MSRPPPTIRDILTVSLLHLRRRDTTLLRYHVMVTRTDCNYESETLAAPQLIPAYIHIFSTLEATPTHPRSDVADLRACLSSSHHGFSHY